MKTRKGTSNLTLEERVQLLEEVEAIKKMKAEYVLACDERRWDDAMRYFTAKPVVDFGRFGRFETWDEVVTFFEVTMPKTIAFTIHRLCNPIIEVKGKTAKGIWYCEIPSTHIPTHKAILQQGTYEDDYVKEGNQWKHKILKLTYTYITEYGEGWVKQQWAFPQVPKD